MPDSTPDTIDALLRHHAASTKPMVIDPDTRISYAELDADTKNRVSHRGRAMQKLIERLPEL